MPAKEAPYSIFPYGKGIYFTDCASKAANFSLQNKEQKEVFMVLAEVALGNMHKAFAPH